MVSFFIGQRVRVVRTDSHLKRKDDPLGGRIGDEGNVVGTCSRPNSGFWSDGQDVLSVKLDRFEIPGIAPSYCFEPILPEGAQPSKFRFTELMDNLGVMVA